MSDPINLLWLAIGIAIGSYGVSFVMFAVRVIHELLRGNTPNARLGDLLRDLLSDLGERTPRSGLTPASQTTPVRRERGRHAARSR